MWTVCNFSIVPFHNVMVPFLILDPTPLIRKAGSAPDLYVTHMPVYLLQVDSQRYCFRHVQSNTLLLASWSLFAGIMSTSFLIKLVKCQVSFKFLSSFCFFEERERENVCVCVCVCVCVWLNISWMCQDVFLKTISTYGKLSTIHLRPFTPTIYN